MAGRVHESIKKLFAGEENDWLDEADTGDYTNLQSATVVTRFDDPEVNHSFAAAYAHFVSLCRCNSHDYLCMAFQSCESPIEVHMLAALIAVACRMEISVAICNTLNDHVLQSPGSVSNGRLAIHPQYKLESYRCDFLVSYSDDVPDCSQRSTTPEGIEIPGVEVIERQVIIECDGHEFHERTKEQAKHDKKRDRTIQTNGFHVFRYTGSEIWNDAATCAKEVIEFLTGTLPHRQKRKPQEQAEQKPPSVTIQDAATARLDSVVAGTSKLIELGIADLDYAIGGGVAPGEVVIIAARPSHGKSAVALQILDTCSRNGMPGLMISEEMSSLAIGKRVLQFVSDEAEEYWGVSETKVRGELAWHFERRAPVYIAENCRTIAKAEATIDWHVKHRSIQIVAVDYAQILTGDGKTAYERVTSTSIALRSIANRLGITFIVLCQLSRAIESRDKFIPRGSDLKESGQLEQDADVIVFLVWPHRIDEKRSPKEFQLFISKNRNRAIMQSALVCEFNPARQMVRTKFEKEQPRVEAFDEWNAAGA